MNRIGAFARYIFNSDGLKVERFAKFNLVWTWLNASYPETAWLNTATKSQGLNYENHLQNCMAKCATKSYGLNYEISFLNASYFKNA